MGRRTIVLVSALLIAALGVLLVLLYVRGADNRAGSGRKTETVLVATQTIATGTTGEQAEADGLYTSKAISADSVAEGALTSIDEVKSLVSLTTVFPGQQLVRAGWGQAQSVTSIPVPSGYLAVSVQLGDPQRVAGFLGPGSEVAVFATVPDPSATAGNGGNVTTTLLRKVTVITVGNVAPVTEASPSSSSSSDTISRAIVTLALTQEQAQKVIYAQSRGQLYLGLVSTGTTLAPLPPTSLQNLLD
jgi:pilus assembly protein CpaB